MPSPAKGEGIIEVNSVLTQGKGVGSDSGVKQGNVMQNRAKPPTSLADLKGKAPGVTVTTQANDEADRVATLALLNFYTQEDGFHCPRCGVVIKKPEEAINHLADEINKSIALLGK